MQRPKKDLKVKVAMRVRPLNSKEIEAGSEKCVQVYRKRKTIAMGKKYAYEFDNLFNSNSK